VSVLELQKTLEPSDATLKAEGFVAPAPWQNDYWTQPGGYANHSLQNVALSEGKLKEIWSTSIGSGSDDDLPLTAQPVVFENMVYTLDTDFNVSAFDIQKGKRIWSNSIRPKKEDESVIGGGLAVAAGMLYATNGYNELIAMNHKKGGIFWRSKLTAPSRAAPTVLGDKVYVLTLDNHLTTFDATTGKEIWKYEGFSENAGLVSAASPAVDNEIVICPMSSGELAALRVENGSVAWSDSLSPSLQTGGAASLPDIAGLPIIDKNVVIAVSYGGKIVSIDLTTGQRIWARDIGGAKNPWVAGNMIFFITSNAELVALGRDTGALAWVKPLADYGSSENTRNSLLWNGPVLAGNRLIITGADDTLLEISPKDGTLIRKLELDSHVAVPPIVAGNTLYLVSDDGTLSAWK
jgi:outer membrane protein assembly factor BamB